MQRLIMFAKRKRKLVFVSILLLLIVFFMFLFFHSNQKSVERTLRKMGENFYRSYYEDLGSDKESFLKNFESKGLKIDLDGLSQYKENEDLLSKMKNNKTKEECNRGNTRVIIYPKSPFGEGDYTLEIELDCGFKKK